MQVCTSECIFFFILTFARNHNLFLFHLIQTGVFFLNTDSLCAEWLILDIDITAVMST